MPVENESLLRLGSMHELGVTEEKLSRVDDGHTSDVAVFAIPFTTRALDITRVSDAGILLAQDVLALGFPAGERYAVDASAGPLSLPMVKKGILAAMANPERPMSLDLIANPGFSGGPVLFAPQDANEIRICGMVSQTATVSAMLDESDARTLLSAAGISTAIPCEPILSIIADS